MSINAPTYARRNKEWFELLGKVGIVVLATTVRVASPEQAAYTPYSFALIQFDDEQKSFMGVGQERLNPGDKVRCVLRKLSTPSAEGIIEYGIKVTQQ